MKSFKHKCTKETSNNYNLSMLHKQLANAQIKQGASPPPPPPPRTKSENKVSVLNKGLDHHELNQNFKRIFLISIHTILISHLLINKICIYICTNKKID